MDTQNVPVWNLNGNKTKTVLNTGELFTSNFRPDLIKRAVLASRRNRQVVYGVDPRAGKRTSAKSVGTGRGLARVPRTAGSRTHSANRAALAPFVVGGRRTHPPEAEQNFTEKVNKKEKKRALASAIAATASPVLVESRGHIIDDVKYLPLVVKDDLQAISKTSKAVEVFENLGLNLDLTKIKRRTSRVRAGRGKSRGRKYKSGKSVLIVIGQDQGIRYAARNVSGVDIITADELNVEYLAPGTHPGRLTVWTESAIKKLTEN
jgi:large subunit ribosomal protein L4e